MQLDVLIFGGGAAGLWLLDTLAWRGARALLLESDRLGSGQTIAAQGIIHGGLKYTLQGVLTPSALQIREMPRYWRECYAGRCQPDLRGMRLRAPFCYLWRTESLASRLAMIGARVGLSVAPQVLPDDDRPAFLARCPGTVARLDEPVIAPESLLETLFAKHRSRILKIEADKVAWKLDSRRNLQAVELIHPDSQCGTLSRTASRRASSRPRKPHATPTTWTRGRRDAMPSLTYGPGARPAA